MCRCARASRCRSRAVDRGAPLPQVRLGFSGTPSDLLPLELGRCHYAMGDDAKMLHVLTSPEHVTYEPQPNEWSVAQLLDQIASSTCYNALIDTGALITGMTNLQVAQHLLQRGLTEFDAVVFLDSHGERNGWSRPGRAALSPHTLTHAPLHLVHAHGVRPPPATRQTAR